MLARRHARPGGEVAPTGELSPVPDRRHDRMGGDEAHARNGAEAAHVRIGFGDLPDPVLKLFDRRRERVELAVQKT